MTALDVGFAIAGFGIVALIERDGWVQGRFFDGRRRCIDGAIMATCAVGRWHEVRSLADEVRAAQEATRAARGAWADQW